jgi:SAM-dependent methyltransferase
VNEVQIRAHYAGLPPAVRWHVALRLALCPFARLATFVPQEGLIVDLGCGHGVFALVLALAAPGRRIVGVDPSRSKIDAAQQALQRHSQIHLVQGDAVHNPIAGPCQAILLIDVLYLLPPAAQVRVIAGCYARLAPGGVLLIKTMDRRPRWKAALNRLEEWLAVRVLGMTLANTPRLTFRSLDQWAVLCRRTGFETLIVHLDRDYYHPHGAVVGVRR